MSSLEDSIRLSSQIRQKAVEMVYNAKASHIGGALSMADILAVLYECVLQKDPSNSQHPDRDRFLLSKGHACVGLYATLALKGYFPLSDLNQYSKDGSSLLSHTSHQVAGVEISAGSLGHGLPIAVGLAIAANRKKAAWKTYCLLSDGELNEGSNWEAIMLAAQLKLDNLIAIIDYNKIQSFGFVDEVIRLEPLKAKFEAFGWGCLEIDGHNHEELLQAFSNHSTGKPLAIVAHTLKGKGVSFMENKLLWHYKSPDQQQFAQAMSELKNELI